jgi:uncharacterized Zn-binding protein involved in type VI secretion
MAGEIIRKGDPTSHRGTVLEGSLTDLCMDKPIAYIGHKVHCPKCRGDYPIVEGVMTTTLYGKGVAVAGMKTSCGAVLIATQFTDTVEWSTGASGAASSAAATPAAAPAKAAPAPAAGTAAADAAAAPEAAEEGQIFDEQYVLVDEMKRALPEMPYTIKLPSGEVIHGTTDLEGRTARYVTAGAQLIELLVGHH